MTPYICPPVFTDLAIKDWLWDCHNLQQFTAICYVLLCSAIFCLPISTTISTISATSMTSAEFCQVYWILLSLLNSAKFCQNYDLKPILPYTRVNWVIKLIICTLFSCFLISFPYVMSWLYYTVHVYSLIIFTLLYIIATCTYSVTFWGIL